MVNNNTSHRRKNLLTGEWVLVSPHRTKRPWQGKEEQKQVPDKKNYDASCYLCPGNSRAEGKKNPDYEGVYVFENDFPALQQNEALKNIDDEFFQASNEYGICKVICYDANHSLSMANMPLIKIEEVIQAWQREYKQLSALDRINYVQIFENKGELMGCSNPHPHGQIWAQEHLPNEVFKKDKEQARFHEAKGVSLLKEYSDKELSQRERIVYANEDYLVLVPFWAVWPYETMIIPRKHQEDISLIDDSQRLNLAIALSMICKTYDKLFDCSFPYSFGIHQAPCNKAPKNHWHWHMSFYPPLLRSATVKKFMVGYEMFGMPQRDLSPEIAAQKLREIADNLSS